MRIDCHCHTIYSKHPFWVFDALNTPLEMIKSSVKRGLNGLAITDHNNVRGSLIAKKVAKKFKNFIILTGSEIRTRDGEIIGLGIKDDVPINLSLEETVDKIHDLGGVAIASHPFGSYIFRRCTGRKSINADAIEAFNSTLTKNQNIKALRLAKEFKKSMTAGSDAHSSREIGNAGILVEGDPLESILKGKVKIFGRKTSMIDIAYLISRKFFRSIKWRMNGNKKYFDYTKISIYNP